MQEYFIDGNVLGFDGTVLEIFGMGDVHRYHIYYLRALIRSRRHFTIDGGKGRGAARVMLRTPDDVAAANALIFSVNRARFARGWRAIPTR